MSWKPEVYIQGEWSSNSLRFASEQEAIDYARDLTARWTLVEKCRATRSLDEISHTWDHAKRKLTDVDSGAEHVPPIRVTL